MNPVWQLGVDSARLRDLVDAARIPSSIIQSALDATRFAEKLALPIEQIEGMQEAMRQAQETAQFASRILERIPLGLPTPVLDAAELPPSFFRRSNPWLSREFLDEDGCEWEIGEDPEEDDEMPMRRIGFY